MRSTDSSTPRDWRQLAALFQALDVDENMADIMFRVTTRGWDLQTLQTQASPGLAGMLKFRQPVLSFRQPALNPVLNAPYEIVPLPQDNSTDDLSDSVELVHFETNTELFETSVVDMVVDYIQTDIRTRLALLDNPPTPNQKRLRSSLGIAAAVTLIVVTGVIWFQTQPSEDRNETQPASPTTPEIDSAAAAPEQELVTCDIDLDTIPAENLFHAEFLTEPGCEDVRMQVQYNDVATDDPNPWNEALNACFAGLVGQLWLHTDPELPEASGWIKLPPGRNLNSSQPTDSFDLYTEPNENSEIVGSLLYTDLNRPGIGDRIRLVLPIEPNPDLKLKNKDEYQLAGCWKGQPRESTNGLHFFYPG